MTTSPRDERGAVAVVAAMIATSLFIVAAFTVDLGQAYVATRQLQTAADAGALAAAARYRDVAGTCADLEAAPKTDAQNAADAKTGQNRLDGTQALGTAGDPIQVSCKDPLTGVDTGTLHVTYTVSGSTPKYFGKLAGRNDTITSSRTATATLDVPTTASRAVRPLMLCSNKVPSTLPSSVVKLSGPSQGSAPPVVGCDGGSNPGNWWFIDCPEDTNNGVTVDRVLNGCSSPVTVVPNQPTTDPSLRNHLINYCPRRSASCLSASPGAAGNNLATAFDTLISKKTEVLLPVFCGQPNCSPAGVVNAGGNNAIYPLYRLVSVTVCGYRFNNQTGEVDWTDQKNIGRCTDNPSNLTAEGAGVKGENYLLVVFHNVQTSGDAGPSSCRIGDVTCDGGLRRVRLTK